MIPFGPWNPASDRPDRASAGCRARGGAALRLRDGLEDPLVDRTLVAVHVGHQHLQFTLEFDQLTQSGGRGIHKKVAE